MDLDDAVREAADLLASDAEPWRPEPGSQILGLLRAIGRRSSTHSTDYPVLTIEDGDGRWYDVHAFHTVLWQEIERQKPNPGDVCGVRYIGKKPGGQNGEGYDAYKLVVVRPEAPSSTVAAPSSLGARPNAVPDRGDDGANGGDGAGLSPPPVAADQPEASSGHRSGHRGVAALEDGPAPALAAIAHGEGARPAPESGPSSSHGDRQEVATGAQWITLLERCGGSMKAATNRINLANRTGYRPETVREEATWAELVKAMELVV